jgi:hypothetical protein
LIKLLTCILTSQEPCPTRTGRDRLCQGKGEEVEVEGQVRTRVRVGIWGYPGSQTIRQEDRDQFNATQRNATTEGDITRQHNTGTRNRHTLSLRSKGG